LQVVNISNITKSYRGRTVVDDVSLDINSGEVFGLIGPNGAGKTTTIRIMMDLVKPDSGNVEILGKTLNEAAKNSIGYLPEERGLYLNMKVIDSLVYLATLKGMDRQSAAKKAKELLQRIDMQDHSSKKIKELSRGMSQFVQFLVTIIHEPDLVVLDEPFANLDPVNTQLIKDMVLEMRNRGKALILSTHRMNEVEELCDRILMIHNGRTVLYGNLVEIKERYSNNSVVVDYEGRFDRLEGVVRRQDHDGSAELFLEAETKPQQILEQLVNRGITVKRFEVATPPLHDIFLQVVEEGQ